MTQPLAQSSPKTARNRYGGNSSTITKANRFSLPFPSQSQKNLSWEEILKPLNGQGYTRVLLRRSDSLQESEGESGEYEMIRIDALVSTDCSLLTNHTALLVVQDRIAA